MTVFLVAAIWISAAFRRRRPPAVRSVASLLVASTAWVSSSNCPIVFGITVSNPGTGPATGVIIEEDVPAGLAHVAGSQLEYDVGTLRPGESKHLDLSLRADKAGVVQNTINVRGEASLAARHAAESKRLVRSRRE